MIASLHRSGRRRLVALIVAAATLAACGGSSTTNPTTTTAAPDPDAPVIEWESCGDDYECGTLAVPFDYADPDAGTFLLSLVRNPADDPDARIGTLLVNPGGPGFGGTSLALQAPLIYGQDLLDAFDIVGWDPRGTGESVPAVDCVDEFDSYFTGDPTPPVQPDTDPQEQSREFAEACERRSGEILPHISTNRSAMDMDTIRRALGEEKISYFGFSYGSELGATWATMFPDTVRAAVLDGTVDPTLGALEAGIAQAMSFERELNKFLARCSGDSECPFHNGGDAEGAFDDLMASLDERPLVVDPERTPVNLAVAGIGVAQALYTSALWPTLESALASAQDGDGSGLLDLWDTYYQGQGDGTYGNELEAFMAISCLDAEWPDSIEETVAANEDYVALAPRIGPGLVGSGSFVCTFWPTEADPRVPISYDGDVEIMVVGTTGDSATPIEGTRRMAEVLKRAVLVTVEVDQHGGYGANSCVQRAVDDYLVALVTPDDLFC